MFGRESNMKNLMIMLLSLLFVTVSFAKEYGVELSDDEKLTALSNYFMKRDSKKEELSLPIKPQKPELPKVPKLTKSKYEKMETFEKRVNIENDNYQKKVKNIEERYAKRLEEYSKDVERITKNYNNKIFTKQKKIKQQSMQKAYATVYGDPYIVEESLEYDAEKEIFSADLKSTKSNMHKQVIIDVPINEAENFEKEIKFMKIIVSLEFVDKTQTIKYIIIKSSKNNYVVKLR